MKTKILIIITIIYLILAVLFNYGLYQLLIISDLNNQYYLIFIYFLSEVLSFFFFFCTKSKDIIIDSALGPIIVNGSSPDISSISDNDNNLTTSLNASETPMDSVQQKPFIGMKCISFLVPSSFDFFSKIFIFNGLKMVGNEIIFRSIIQLLMVLFFSKVFLKSKYDNFNVIGVFVILGALIVGCFHYQFSQTIKVYFGSDTNGIIGMILCNIGEVLGSVQIFFQMKYFRIGEKYCYREIAWEGLFGLIISFIVFEISLLFPCSDKEEENNNNEIYKNFLYCYEDSSDNSIQYLLSKIKSNIIWNIVFFISSIFYSLVGAIIAKYIGELYRAAIDVGRLSIILYLILILNIEDISLLSVIICGIYIIIIIFGIILAIALRKQKNNTFVFSPLDKSYG